MQANSDCRVGGNSNTRYTSIICRDAIMQSGSGNGSYRMCNFKGLTGATPIVAPIDSPPAPDYVLSCNVLTKVRQWRILSFNYGHHRNICIYQTGSRTSDR